MGWVCPRNKVWWRYDDGKEVVRGEHVYNIYERLGRPWCLSSSSCAITTLPQTFAVCGTFHCDTSNRLDTGRCARSPRASPCNLHILSNCESH